MLRCLALVALSLYLGQIQALSAAAPVDVGQLDIGGYGELTYFYRDADIRSNDLSSFDFYHFVLALGYAFSEDLRLIAEVEFEHGGTEVALEQGYLEYDFSATMIGRAGVFLLPIGFINETHEPPSFYGVERNQVERVIIPTTWWVGGLMLSRRWDSGLTVELALHEPLEMTSAQVRGGRQKSARANFKEPALTAAVNYRGIPGLTVGAALQYQSDPAPSVAEIGDGLLLSGHVNWQYDIFAVRALAAGWLFDVTGSVESAGYDEQYGWFIEPSVRLSDAMGVFVRITDVRGGRAQDDFKRWTLGLSLWPHEQVVIKLDYQGAKHDLADQGGRDYNSFNVGLGYQF